MDDIAREFATWVDENGALCRQVRCCAKPTVDTPALALGWTWAWFGAATDRVATRATLWRDRDAFDTENMVETAEGAIRNTPQLQLQRRCDTKQNCPIGIGCTIPPTFLPLEREHACARTDQRVRRKSPPFPPASASPPASRRHVFWFPSGHSAHARKRTVSNG